MGIILFTLIVGVMLIELNESMDNTNTNMEDQQMKILLRDYYGNKYVWKTAKYNNKKFHVEGDSIKETNVVSVINDNRKNYIECSCCGQVFRRGDRRFKTHKANAIKPETCFDCPNLCVDNEMTNKISYAINADGCFVRKIEEEVILTCSNSGIWSYSNIMSNDAIIHCKKRQCVDAEEANIVDFFIMNPGVFDDIITIDSLLDNGYNVMMNDRSGVQTDIIREEDYTIGVVINHLGIVDRFHIWFNCDKYVMFYSKRYNELFTESRGEYTIWNPIGLGAEMRNEIKAYIAKLYN